MEKELVLKATKYSDIFGSTKEEIRKVYQQLAKIYHPDVFKDKDADSVFAKINNFYEEALQAVEKGVWQSLNEVKYLKKDGKEVSIKYNKEYSYELGRFFVGDTILVYELENKGYFDNALKEIAGIKYKDVNMEKEFKRYLPSVKTSFETKESKYIIVMNKTKDVYLLKDVLEQQSGKLEPKHVAWVISRLLNILCLFYVNNKVHNGLSLNTCFVSPSFHTIMPYGGWWYTTNENEKMLGTQRIIYDVMLQETKQSKLSKYSTDLESVKMIGRQLLGSRSLVQKQGEIEIAPKEMVAWLMSSSVEDPIKAFKMWGELLEKIWGKREFIHLDITKQDIYK